MNNPNASVEPEVVRAGVGVIVCKNQKVLIGKRANSHGEGMWAFPGGHIEPSDNSLKDCAQREVLEETGITCHVYSPDKYREDLFTTFDILSDDRKKIYVTCYLVADYLLGGYEINEPDTILPLEPLKCSTWKWVTLEELAKIVQSEQAKSWIPVEKVIYYLKNLWSLK